MCDLVVLSTGFRGRKWRAPLQPAAWVTAGDKAGLVDQTLRQTFIVVEVPMFCCPCVYFVASPAMAAGAFYASRHQRRGAFTPGDGDAVCTGCTPPWFVVLRALMPRVLSGLE